MLAILARRQLLSPDWQVDYESYKWKELDPDAPETKQMINSLFIEHEVEAKDLAGALYASQIIDSNDRDEILGASLHLHDPSGLGERLKTIEDLWDILSRRVTRIERRVQELTSTNTHKAALIEDLVGEVQQKTEQLQQAQNRIEELEQRILELETEKAKSSEVVESLREELDQHREHVKHQEDWFNAENLRLKNKLLQQEKAIQQQDSRVAGLQQRISFPAKT
nr:hypothetical protein BaRGS_026350 [Batillaria attramentaria]